MQPSGDIYLPIDPEKLGDNNPITVNGIVRCCRRERKCGTLRRVLSIGLVTATIALVTFMMYSKFHRTCTLNSIKPGALIDDQPTMIIASKPDMLVGNNAGALDDDDGPDFPSNDWEYGMFLHRCGGPKLGGGAGNGTSTCLTPQRQGWKYGFTTYSFNIFPRPPGVTFGVCIYSKGDCTVPLTKYPAPPSDACKFSWSYSMKVFRIVPGPSNKTCLELK